MDEFEIFGWRKGSFPYLKQKGSVLIRDLWFSALYCIKVLYQKYCSSNQTEPSSPIQISSVYQLIFLSHLLISFISLSWFITQQKDLTGFLEALMKTMPQLLCFIPPPSKRPTTLKSKLQIHSRNNQCIILVQCLSLVWKVDLLGMNMAAVGSDNIKSVD